jgi:hypothetical protein
VAIALIVVVVIVAVVLFVKAATRPKLMRQPGLGIVNPQTGEVVGGGAGGGGERIGGRPGPGRRGR